ncbi:MAG: transporter, partial [Verrucomicrobiota bacterium]
PRAVAVAGSMAMSSTAVVLRLPMQLGSGTWDLKPGITYLGQSDAFSWGGQVLGTIRLGDNSANYTLGNDLTVNAWAAYQLSDSLSASLRATGMIWEDVDGADSRLNPMAVPTARPDLRGGQRIDLFGGINYQFQTGLFEGHRIAAEVGKTVWRDLDGPQLGMDWMATVGWQKAF